MHTASAKGWRPYAFSLGRGLVVAATAAAATTTNNGNNNNKRTHAAACVQFNNNLPTYVTQ